MLQCCRSKHCSCDEVSMAGQAAVRVNRTKGALKLIKCLANANVNVKERDRTRACANGNACGRCLVASRSCAPDMQTFWAPKCDNPKVGEGDYCEGDGECGTSQRLGSRIWGQKMGSGGSRLAESERGIWFRLKRHSICTPPFKKERAHSFPGAVSRFCPHILEPRPAPQQLRRLRRVQARVA